MKSQCKDNCKTFWKYFEDNALFIYWKTIQSSSA